MKQLSDSWSAFSPKIALKYLNGFGHPSASSKALLLEVLKKMSKGLKTPSILDLGCGNGQLYEYFESNGYVFSYTGIDFSNSLLDAARINLPNVNFVQDDLNNLEKVTGQYDFAIYSHVVELLESPERALRAALKHTRTVVIRFYEPPDFEEDAIELRWMDVGQSEEVPFIRRKMSRDYYRLILAKLNCKEVNIYRDITKDQIHVLYF